MSDLHDRYLVLAGGALREWQYWTRNKLQILEGYLPAFNRASTRSRERLYIDLMAGQPINVDKSTGEEFDGSARLALKSDPGFTRLAFCEMGARAAELNGALTREFPRMPFQVYAGDCNQSIDRVLRDLSPWRWAPTFAFIDQQAAEVTWSTLKKLAAFRSGNRKTELWVLVSPSMTAKGVKGTKSELFASRVDSLYGSTDWRRIQTAREAGYISASDYREHMVNLLRWRLEHELRYQQTERIPMKMPSGVPIYDMVFATDHPVGTKIMTSLYRKAAEREPGMIAQALAVRAQKRDDEAGRLSLFDTGPIIKGGVEDVTWEHTGAWDPTRVDWW